MTLAPGDRASVPTGLAVELPPGHAGLVLPRSGLALRHGVALVNAPGLIDAGYRGEVRVLLLNTDREQPFDPRSRATGSPSSSSSRSPTPEPVEVDELGATARGDGGFGSSGGFGPGGGAGAGGERASAPERPGVRLAAPPRGRPA